MKSRRPALALGCALAWLAAAAMAPWIGVWPALGGAAVVLGVVVLWLDRAAQVELLRPSVRLVLLGALAGSLMAGATYVLYPPLARLLPFIATDTAHLYAAFRAAPPLIATLALVPIIVGEELVWRGVVQTALVRRLGPWPGVVCGAVVYGCVHAPVGSPVLPVVALFCGLAWGVLQMRSGSLVPTLVAHMVWNVVVLLWLPLDIP